MQRIHQINVEPAQFLPLESKHFPRFIEYLQTKLYKRSDENLYFQQNQDVLKQLEYNRELLNQLIQPHVFQQSIGICQILCSQLLETQRIYKLLFDQSHVQSHIYCKGSMGSLRQEDENQLQDLCKNLEVSLKDAQSCLELLLTRLKQNILDKEYNCKELRETIEIKLQSQPIEQGCYHRFQEDFRKTEFNQEIDQIYQCECNLDPQLQTLQAIIFNLLSEKFPRQFLTDERLKPLLGQQNNLSLYLSDIIEIGNFEEKMLHQPPIQKASEFLKFEAMIVGNYKLTLNYVGEGSLRYQQELMEDDDDGQLYNQQEYFYALRELMLNLKQSYKKKQLSQIHVCICNVFITKVDHSSNVFGIRLRIGNKVCRGEYRGVAFFLSEYYRVFLKQVNRSFVTDSDYETLKTFIKNEFRFDNTYRSYFDNGISASAKNKVRFLMYALYNLQKVIEYLNNRPNIRDYFRIKEYEIKQALITSQCFRNADFLNIDQSMINVYQQNSKMQDLKAQVNQYLNNHPNNLIKLRMLFSFNECLLCYPKVNETFQLYSQWNQTKYLVLPKYLELYLQNPQFSLLIEQMINQIQTRK